MKQRFIYLLIAILIFMNCSENTGSKPDETQKQPEVSFPTNTEIEYGIGRALDTTVAPFISGDFKVVILSDKETEMLHVFDDTLLLQKLNDTTTDWSANLLLYAKHDRDALSLKDCDIATWRRVYKKEDVRYWNEKLKHE